MNFRALSKLCFGCEPLGGTDWGKVDVEAVKSAIWRALDLGVNFFDTADVYGLGLSEERLSDALGHRRHEVVIATKGGVSWSSGGPGTRARIRYDASPDYLRGAVERSLRRLRLESLPIYFVHWPDQRTPIEDTFGILDRLRAAGKIRSIGCSNFSAEQVERACRSTTVSLVQVPGNILESSQISAMARVCSAHQVSLVAYNVLAQGLLSGKFGADASFSSDDRRSRSPLFQGERYRTALAQLGQIRFDAEAEGLSAAQYAIRWVLCQPHVVSVIVGVKSVAQLEENVAGALAPPLRL